VSAPATQAETPARPVIDAVVGELRPGPNGDLELPELGARRVEALVLMAAHHPDEGHGGAALTDVLRVALALDARAPAVAAQLRDLLRRTPGALARLDRRRRGADVQARFQRQMGQRGESKRAPRHDAPRAGVRLADLGRDVRPRDPAEVRARRGLRADPDRGKR
jgi:hypothetical protein